MDHVLLSHNFNRLTNVNWSGNNKDERENPIFFACTEDKSGPQITNEFLETAAIITSAGLMLPEFRRGIRCHYRNEKSKRFLDLSSDLWCDFTKIIQGEISFGFFVLYVDNHGTAFLITTGY